MADALVLSACFDCFRNAVYGWYCRYGPSVNTRRLVVEEGSFLEGSDYCGDDLSIWTRVNDIPHLIMPYSLTNNGGNYAGGMGIPDHWFSHMRDAFDMLYKEDCKGQPKILSLGLRMRLMGDPVRAVALRRPLDDMADKRDAWITHRVDIARHWVAGHPAKQ